MVLCADDFTHVLRSSNTTEGWQSLKDSKPIRQAALAARVPYFTTAPASVEAAKAIAAGAGGEGRLEVLPLQDYHSRRNERPHP